MPENKDLADKDLADLSEEEAAQLAYSRSTASLDDYNPKELAPEDRVVEWDKKSYENSQALADEQPQASTATQTFRNNEPRNSDETPRSRKGGDELPAAGDSTSSSTSGTGSSDTTSSASTKDANVTSKRK